MSQQITANRLQLVLLPGLGADWRQWEPPELAFPGLMVPPWIPPLRGDTLPTYIHGQRDRMIRASVVSSDSLVPDGGHLINLSHAAQVNDFIRKVLASAE